MFVASSNSSSKLRNRSRRTEDDGDDVDRFDSEDERLKLFSSEDDNDNDGDDERNDVDANDDDDDLDDEENVEWRTQLVLELSTMFCGVTPLYVAAAYGQSSFIAEMLALVGPERAVELVRCATSVNDTRSQSLLHVAAVHAQGRVITAVLNALPRFYSGTSIVDAVDGSLLGRCTALHCAAERGPMGAGVVELLQGGADFRAINGRGEQAIDPTTWSAQAEVAMLVFLPAVVRGALQRKYVPLVKKIIRKERKRER